MAPRKGASSLELDEGEGKAEFSKLCAVAEQSDQSGLPDEGGEDDARHEKPGEEKRKCSSICQKELPRSSFDSKEYRCKKCRALETSVLRRYGELANNLKATNLPKYIKVCKLFNKSAPPDSTKSNRRTKGVTNALLKTTASSKSGKRYASKVKMMWEREYYDEAAKTYMGNLTSEDRALRWGSTVYNGGEAFPCG